MKDSLLIFVSVLCLSATVQSYSGRNRDPLGELLKARKTRGSREKLVIKDSTGNEYSPVYLASQEGLKELDAIEKLPGQPEDMSLSQYSGYVTVDPTAGRALFYWLTESDDSSTKPLVLWLNGGPGCSSVGGGAMTELGPFRVNSDGKTLWYNDKAWSTVANILFLESPAGVGFSYSNTTSDYATGDTRTAADSYTFLVNWLERFPEYKTRDFYVAGESYAGHYVPQLAQLILKNNQITNQTFINLKGIAIGNAYIDAEDMGRGFYDFFWSHAMNSNETHEAVMKSCDFSSAEPSEECKEASKRADDDLRNIFIYNIYSSDCGSNSTAPSLQPSSYDSCSLDYVSDYLNDPEVQKALHANITRIPAPWSLCGTDEHHVEWEDSPDSVLPVINELMGSGISVWIYSGDTDGRIPVTATLYSLAKLGAPVKTPWYPWDCQGEVGGYSVGYENLTFVTIRGAGHLVPSYQPERALTFFSSFLEGKLPPPIKT